ncbi:hypothetical protein OG21DRAFT_1164517 [Imleria badia]|nr:hypothetical protein OG21DRAFT_1164517 [Imleria badia]
MERRLRRGDEQLNCGACHIGCSTPSHRMRDHRHDTPPWRAPRFNYRSILRSGEGFALRVNKQHRATLLIPRDLVRQYSIRIRSGVNSGNLPATPIGYDTFAHVFNSEPQNPHRLSTLDDNSQWAMMPYSEPPPSLFFGANAAEADVTPADPRIREIGNWLLDREFGETGG